MKTFNAHVQRLLACFIALTGTKFVGIREYISVKTGEVANFVVNANFNYGNAIEKTVEILKSLAPADFQTIEKHYGVVNSEGTKYGTNKGAVEYLESGKLPKEGTKARENVLKAVHETKTLATICFEMVNQFIANQNEETRSAQSIAQSEAYEPVVIDGKVVKAVKRNKESGKLHIWAMAHSKEVLIEGEYPESTPKIETAQKNAIERYCRDILKKQLPTTKYRNFVIEPNQLSEVKATGESFQFIG